MREKYEISLFLLFIFSSVFFACGETPEKARKELSIMGIKFSEEVFIDRVKHGDIVVVRLFLKAGMNPNVKDNNGMRCLVWSIIKNNTEITNMLLNSGANPNNRENRFPASMFRELANEVKDRTKGNSYFVSMLPGPNIAKYAYFTPLMLSIILNNENIMKMLINKNVKLNETIHNNITALMIATSYGDKNMVKMLIDKGADPNIKDATGKTALRIAIGSDHKEIINILERVTKEK